MTAFRIFYAWQSDRPAKLCRSLVRKALDDAAEQLRDDLTIVDAPLVEVEIDQDTQGKAGSPPVAETILQKIRESDAFVADLTFTGCREGKSGSPVPNPNVLIEYGYALHALGGNRVIAVFNEEFGNPEDLPFDLQHRRWPIRYQTSGDGSDEEAQAARRSERTKLASALATAIKTIVQNAGKVDQTPFQRVQNYLLDREGWTQTSEYVWHHSQFPEFTISPTEEEPLPVRGGDSWVRAALNPSAFVYPLQVCFHQTVLAEVDCILYDEIRAITPTPEPRRVDKGLWFFSLCAGTLKFLFLQFLTGKGQEQLLRDGLGGGRLPNVPVILFRSGEERQRFLQELEHNPATVEARHEDTVFGQNDPMISEQDRTFIAYSKAAIERLDEWRKGNR